MHIYMQIPRRTKTALDKSHSITIESETKKFATFQGLYIYNIIALYFNGIVSYRFSYLERAA